MWRLHGACLGRYSVFPSPDLDMLMSESDVSGRGIMSIG